MPAADAVDAVRRRLLLAGLVVGCAVACGEPVRVPASGSMLPPLAFARLDGSAASSTDHAGRALVLNLWATWCQPCRAEMPSLQRLADAFAASDLEVIGVSVDEDLNLVREFLLRHAIRFPVYADTRQPAVRSMLAVGVYPTTWLVRRDGRIAEVVTGERDWASADSLARIEALLAVRRRAPDGA